MPDSVLALLTRPRSLRVVAVLSALCMWAGCSGGIFHRASVRSLAKSGNSSVDSSGEISRPATASTNDTTATVPIPAGAVVTISTAPQNSPGALPVAVVTSHSEVATSPVNYPPALPPTPAQVAAGDGVRVFYWIAAGCAVGAIVAIYVAHYLAAGILAGAAALIPFLVHLGETVLASHFAVAAICLSLGLVVAYEILKGKLPAVAVLKTDWTTVETDLKARLVALESRVK